MAKLSEEVRKVVYLLELSEDEARYLYWLTGTKVLGRGPWREVNDAIFHALPMALGDTTIKVADGDNRVHLTD